MGNEVAAPPAAEPAVMAVAPAPAARTPRPTAPAPVRVAATVGTACHAPSMMRSMSVLFCAIRAERNCSFSSCPNRPCANSRTAGPASVAPPSSIRLPTPPMMPSPTCRAPRPRSSPPLRRADKLEMYRWYASSGSGTQSPSGRSTGAPSGDAVDRNAPATSVASKIVPPAAIRFVLGLNSRDGAFGAFGARVAIVSKA